MGLRRRRFNFNIGRTVKKLEMILVLEEIQKYRETERQKERNGRSDKWQVGQMTHFKYGVGQITGQTNDAFYVKVGQASWMDKCRLDKRRSHKTHGIPKCYVYIIVLFDKKSIKHSV